ncbi:MAG: diguanylate cyclase [Acidimicrobiales bacterium]|nr:diguanylate cyclase [Acidimicrobiales bacterium]
MLPTMAEVPEHPGIVPAATTDDAPDEMETATSTEAPGRGAARRRPRVRSVIALVVLLPLLSTGVLITASAVDAWKVRDHAQVAADDANQLRTVAVARAVMNQIEVPLTAVSYSGQLGISEPQLDSLLQQRTPFRVQLRQVMATAVSYPTFSSTPTLRADMAELARTVTAVENRTTTYPVVHVFLTKMAADIDAVWYQAYDHLQSDIAAWQPPGSFEVHAAALRQTYTAFLAGGHEVEGGIYVLEGTGPADAKQELIQAAGEYQASTAQIVGHLGPSAQQAWNVVRTSSADQHFAATIQQGLNVALGNEPPPFLGNVSFAGSSMTPGLHYLADLNVLVTAASSDLHDTAAAQAGSATGRLVGELIFLGLLALLCLGGVIVATKVLTRPLQRLAGAAFRIRSGDFDTEHIPEQGPLEIATTIEAFNEMSGTLHAVQTKAIALADEDLSSPDLLRPLPGRTGLALQASVDLLATRIRERELQRQLLHEAAIHDPLTGLLNRGAVIQYLTEDVARRRDAGETVAVLFVDLDGLKPLNDNFGHVTGDAAILTTAMALMFATEPCDVVGRLGGDEFLVVLCHRHSLDSDAALDRIRESIAARTISVDGTSMALEASVGVALAQCDPNTDPMVLVRQADEAMYEAKKTARMNRLRGHARLSGHL